MFYVQRDGIEHGPVSGEQLKRMVTDGRLQRTDKLRKADDTVWHLAGKVKSLFPEVQLPPTSHPSAHLPSSYRTIEVFPAQATDFQPVPTVAQTIPEQPPRPQFAPPQAIHLPMAVAAPQPMAVASPVAPALDVLCPFCQEQIKREAKKCKHCGEILDVVLRQGCNSHFSRASEWIFMELRVVLASG